MSAGCGSKCEGAVFDGMSSSYKRVLWTVIAINGAMFLVEMTAGLQAGSQALQADALDFFGDTATYAISLMVLGQALHVRAKAALFKGLSLAVFGLYVLGSSLYHIVYMGQPEPVTIGAVGVLALLANAISAGLLFRFREGDSNVRSVWLCSRNDAIGNVAVIFAAGGVWLSGTAWPDLIVALAMALLFLNGARQILGQALGELRQTRGQTA
ncbi:MAG: cation transporter [Rhodovibrionaceae bacterium]